MDSPLKLVKMRSDVYMVCLQHALSTENFEVMGLLIGENIDGVSIIKAATILRRSDKKKDRVEISVEQLMKATEEADRLTKELEEPMRVLGWYHSHPHITVFPSHVDIGTQQTYQTMDRNFAGLIFSVFTEEKTTKEQQVFLTCFQSMNGKAKEIPLLIYHTPEISAVCTKTMAKLPTILALEEEEMAEGCEGHPDYVVQIYNNAVKVRALGHIGDTLTRPLLNNIYNRYKMNLAITNFLKQQFQELKSELESL